MPSGDFVEPQPASNTPQRRPLSQLLPAALAVLAFGFALGCVVQLRFALFSFFSGAGHSLRTIWLRPILYGIFGLLFFLLLRAILHLIDMAIHAISLRNRAEEPPPKTVDEFIEEAGRLHISPRVAREAFQLFASLVPGRTSIDLHDDLRAQVGLSDQQITSLLASLPDLCDRSKNPVDLSSVLSVYDLLHHIECAPVWKAGQFDQRSGLPAPPPATAPTSPLADLQNASPRDSRFRTRTHFSGMKRRASDYSGPFRRATDRRPDADYAGPRRRASDRQTVDGQPAHSHESGHRDSDRRILDRRSASQNDPVQDTAAEARQHKAANTSLLNSRPDQPRAQKPATTEAAILAAPTTRETSSQSEAGLHRN